jgi:AcrR family transcriptional regulator
MSAMSELTRKERELLQREQLILDTAQNMLYAHGYAQLTMDRIAEKTEYSKGTIYNHFSSKEELVCSLCCRCISNLTDLFTRASNYAGSTRERYSAIGIGYSLYYQLNPMDAQNIQIIRINAVRDKVGEKKLREMESLEKNIAGIAMNIVNEAIECGDLKTDNAALANSIVFGCWSMHYGALLLDQSDIPLSDLGFSPTVSLLWHNSQKFLDGFNWHSLSTEIDSDALFKKLCNEVEIDSDALFKKLCNEVFEEEIKKLNN